MKRILRTFVIALWLVMAAWLVRYEAFPDRFSHTLDGYRGLIRHDVLIEDSWMRILFNGTPIGYSHSSMDVKEGNVLRRFQIDNRTELRLTLMGERRRVHVDTEVFLDALYNLREFSFSMEAAAYRMRLKATRGEGNSFRVALRAGESSQHLTLQIPDDVVLYSPMTEAVLKRLKPGQALTIRTLDPASLSVAPLTIRALRQERLQIGGKTHETTVLEAEYHGASVLSWLDEHGNVLREQTPFGWTLEACSAEEAFAAVMDRGKDEDLLKGLAVKCDGVVRDPENARALRLRLTGVTFAPGELASSRQIVEELRGNEATLLLLHARVPEQPADAAAIPDDCREFLKATPFVQSDHPDIVRRALTITAGKTNLLEKAGAVCDWVYGHVEKEMTVSLPSALDVLRTMKGDCNEHTYLFVALARAAGVPARIRVGVAYRDGAFYYHAWPAAWMGDWVEMEPTWGRWEADATHLALAEGELASQLELLKSVGQLRIAVLEELPPEKRTGGGDSI